MPPYFDYRTVLHLRGEYLPIGGHGPAWVVYPRDEIAELKTQEDSKWIWAIVRIDVE